MDSQDQATIRSAAYLATRERVDARGRLATRTGKTRGVDCNPPNVKCGGRCIPPNWDCRLKGQGTNSELQAHRTDPLAGIASIQRGAKDLARGVVTLNPSRVQRGRSSLIRGAVKLAPGDNLEQKKQLKRQLTAASTPVMAVLGVTLGPQGSVFLQHATNQPGNIATQIQELNKMVLDYSIQQVYSEAQGYMKYIDDISTLVVPIAHPVMANYNDRQLEFKKWF